jgi:hypothetical protein
VDRADVLASLGLFARAWPRLLTSYAADAIGRRNGKRLQPQPARVLERIVAASVEEAPAVGLGVECPLSGNAVGALLLAEPRLAHLAAFGHAHQPRTRLSGQPAALSPGGSCRNGTLLRAWGSPRTR